MAAGGLFMEKGNVRMIKMWSRNGRRGESKQYRQQNYRRAAAVAVLVGTGLMGAILLLPGCQRTDAAAGKTKTDEALVVYCPHPLEFINPIVSEFEARTGISVDVQTGGTGELLARAEADEEPRCDIFWGGSFSTTVEKAGLFEPYISENEDMVQEEFRNAEGNITRFTDVPSVLMVNTNLIGEIPVEGYKDLLNPELKGRIAMCDPARSSSAYEHLINMLYAMGGGDPEAGWDYVEAFCRNLDGKLLSGSSAVYQGVGEGRYVVGLTFEEGGAHYVADGQPVRLVYMEEGVVSTPDVVCIRKRAAHREAAEEFVDFVTGKDCQSIICATLDRRSVRVDVEEPEYLPDKAAIPIIHAEDAVVREKKQEWLKRFGEIYAEASEGNV